MFGRRGSNFSEGVTLSVAAAPVSSRPMDLSGLGRRKRPCAGRNACSCGWQRTGMDRGWRRSRWSSSCISLCWVNLRRIPSAAALQLAAIHRLLRRLQDADSGYQPTLQTSPPLTSDPTIAGVSAHRMDRPPASCNANSRSGNARSETRAGHRAHHISFCRSS